MTDAGGLTSMLDGGYRPDRTRLLRRIADVVGLPVSAFETDRVDVGRSAGASLAECDALIAAFLRIDDPKARRRCLDMVRAAAQG
ncbi:hypothetical protein [Methylobacterium trifolii]|nr:hypothetical protein [Methylobacterium trifolii]